MTVRARLVANWELKLVALAVAFALWVFVVSSDRSQMAFAAPIEFVGLADNIVLAGEHPDTVEVQLQAVRWALGQLNVKNIRVRVSLAGVPEGESVVPLSPALVEVPPGVTVMWLTPARVRLRLAAAMESELPVEAQIRGVPASGHRVGRVRVEPPAVKVKGPRSTIERRVAIETVPVDVSSSRSTVTQTVGLVLPEFVYPMKDRSVQVTVDIKPEDGMRGGKAVGP